MSRAKKSTVVETQAELLPEAEASDAEVVEAPAQSGEVRSESPNAATAEAQPTQAASVSCGPLRLKQQGTGYSWAESPHMPAPQASASVWVGPHGYGAAASLGQAGIARSKATHPKPEQAAAELEELITAGLAKARANAAAMVARARSRPGFPPEQRQLGQAEQDLVAWAERVGWVE